MTDTTAQTEPRVASARELSRRRLLAAMGIATTALALPGHPAFTAQTASPTAASQADIDKLISLSQMLCGGGSFDAGQAETLLALMTSGTSLARGLQELYAAAPAPPVNAASPAAGTDGATPVAGRSPEAAAAAKAILLFWYAGVFKDEPIQNRSAIYTNLVAWQAMYTPAWTTCKVYGEWADQPLTAPQVPENV